MSLKNLKNYILILFWILYFIFYIYYQKELLNFFELKKIWKMAFSILSALIATSTSFYTITLILRWTRKFAHELAERRNSRLYPIIAGMFIKFLSYANYIFSAYLGFSLLLIPKEYLWFVNKSVSTIFIVISLLVLSNIIITIFEKRGLFQFRFANNLSKHLSSIIKKILLVFVWIIWGITIISNLWYDVSALITWAWIWWIALALWAQKSLTNIFWAITIVLNKPFRIWDFIRIWEKIWTVKDIWISYLTIIDRSWHQMMVPNEIVVSSFVENYDVRENRRIELTLQLEYWTSTKKLNKAKEIIQNILNEEEKVTTIEESRINFDNFWEYSLNIKITYFSLINDYAKSLNQKDEINFKIKEQFKDSKINIAFPTRRLFMKKEKRKKVLKKKL